MESTFLTSVGFRKSSTLENIIYESDHSPRSVARYLVSKERRALSKIVNLCVLYVSCTTQAFELVHGRSA